MVEVTQTTDPILAKLGENGPLEDLKEQRISLHLARGRVYDILSRAFSYPWNRKFFRPKSLLGPMDIVMADEDDWGTVQTIVDGMGKYLSKMTVKQVQQEYIRVLVMLFPWNVLRMKCSMVRKAEFNLKPMF